ncbi:MULTISPECIES: type II toxin-antitoxin system Phd/YefM family antitoxin [Sediminimonas]|uniref:Antitoxin n=1 Tax=Sediminimonas qiaohouensis TaxID=552061 RepID=A0A7C9L888_9RHOB|nr:MULTISPECIES: type II toxin-antitoxin system Phd/YefM family antitoxin [Sediminimonas]MDR9485960.1 type II toxin-antitoxin system Phd/YefM family antitoxin [Sediminimonas sp.]MTJ04953.1 type II toxin-antitoxin system Phd/YefM family antitoxin [Sediminimonas qiaohouensis]
MSKIGTLGTLSTMTLRNQMSAAINQVVYRERRFLITRRGREVAALVTPEDLNQLEEFWRKTLRQKELEQLHMLEAWRQAKAESLEVPPGPGDGILFVP